MVVLYCMMGIDHLLIHEIAERVVYIQSSSTIMQQIDTTLESEPIFVSCLMGEFTRKQWSGCEQKSTIICHPVAVAHLRQHF